MKRKKTLQPNQPLVTVIMTAFNAERFIDEAIMSVIRQTYKNIEFIIVDDGSTDKTNRHIREFARRFKRIRAYHLKQNVGPSDASNFAFAKAKGKYVARMDADDISYPDRIAAQVDFMERHPGVAMVGGQCDIIDEEGNVIGEKRFPLSHDEIRDAMFLMNPIQHPGCMFRMKIYRKAKIKYEKRYHVSHDLKIMYRLLPYGHLANVPETVIQYRHRPQSITHLNPKRTFAETMEIRHWALLNNNYVPTLKGLVGHTAEMVAVTVLPNSVINSLFVLWRISPIDEVKRAVRTTAIKASQIAYALIPAIVVNLFIRETK